MRDEILARVAPCGLVCGTCMGFQGGPIQASAESLMRHLDGVAEYIEMHIPQDKARFDAFLPTLQFYAGRDCGGCRSGSNRCRLVNCAIRECTCAKDIDFCADCDEFPCDKVHLNDSFMRYWRAVHRDIRENGIEAFYGRMKDRPHYERFK